MNKFDKGPHEDKALANEDELMPLRLQHTMMNEAIALARSMQGKVWPNPAVGCIIAHGRDIVGRGRTQFGGRPHAERVALDDAGALARGASLYVTLEPCCHWGKTPPCADAIIAAGVSEVFASIQDPDPRVNGGGFQKLRDVGIKVHVGLGAVEALEIMAGFFHRVKTGRPLITFGDTVMAPAVIPEGFDARIMSGPDQSLLITRSHLNDFLVETLVVPDNPSILLLNLGERGLTTVYVSSGDQLSRYLKSFVANSGELLKSTSVV